MNLSSELFLFNYISKQFDKDKLFQLPRVIYFSCLYDIKDNKIRDIYQIKKEKDLEERGKKGKKVAEEKLALKEINEINTNTKQDKSSKQKIEKGTLNRVEQGKNKEKDKEKKKS